MRIPKLFVATAALLSLMSFRPSASLGVATTTWAHFPAGPFPLNTPTVVPLKGTNSVKVTVATGGSQGVNGSDLDTLGIAETLLQYTHLRCLAIFNGGGSASVPTSLTFSDIQVDSLHRRGFLMVGAVNAASSPITVTSSVAGRVQTWSVVGIPFASSTDNSFAITWDAGTGGFITAANVGNDSRCIVIDLGDLRNDGTITVSLSQFLNDGILYAFGEETLVEAADVPATLERAGVRLAAPSPNPTRLGTQLGFALPEDMRVRINAFDVGGRRVATLAEGAFGAGEHTVNWNLRDSGGSRVPDGLYFARLEWAGGSLLRRMVILR